jgi:uncharacterized membrane protein YjjP (DUF1212 family)
MNVVLRAGELLLEHGAEAERVEHTMHSWCRGLGHGMTQVPMDRDTVIVTQNGGLAKTQMRRVRRKAIDMQLLENISHLTHRIERGRIEPVQLAAELRAMAALPRHYSPMVTALIAGIGCGAFCRLFGGDWPAFGLTLLAAMLGSATRTQLLRKRVNGFPAVAAAAAVAAGIVLAVQGIWHVSATIPAALSACVLMLVPGAAFVNAINDAVKGYPLSGLQHAVDASLVVLFIAVGVLFATSLVDLVARLV